MIKLRNVKTCVSALKDTLFQVCKMTTEQSHPHPAIMMPPQGKPYDGLSSSSSLSKGATSIASEQTQVNFINQATVIDHLSATGSFKGLFKGILVRDKRGITFALTTGLPKSARLTPPRFGQVVLYQHFGYTHNGQPKSVKYLGIKP